MRLPSLMMIALIILSLVDDFGIWRLARDHFHRKRRTWTVCWWGFAVVCYILLAIILAMPRRSENVDILVTMWMLYAYLTIYASKTVALLFGLLGQLPRLFKRKTRNSILWLGLPFGALTFIVMWWGALVTRHEIDVREVNIVSSKIPVSFNGYKIVQISDMHVGTWGNDTVFISHLVDSVLAQKPDLIVFTGDIVNRQTHELQPFLATLSRLQAPDGTLSILGNHDYGDYITWDSPSDREANNKLLAEWEKSMGWKLLNNEHVYLVKGNDSIPVIGVENWGEPPFHQYGHLEDAYPFSPDSIHNLNDARFKILLSHNPEHWRQEVSHKTNIDLTLSGHTHAMQFRISLGDNEWSPAKWKYEEWGGLYEKNNDNGVPTQIYVNIGSGEVGMPFRIGATPEITVINLWNPTVEKEVVPTEPKR